MSKLEVLLRLGIFAITGNKFHVDTIMAKLVETGEKDKLKDMLREKLSECGWREELKEHCKKIIREKGVEKVSIEELVAEITPKGRGIERTLSRGLL